MKDTVRIVGISTSPRRAANTEYMVAEALSAGENLGHAIGLSVETKRISLANKNILPCSDCGRCIKERRYCLIQDDWLEIVKNIIEPVPDGLIIGSPVYMFNVNSRGRSFMERCTTLFKKVWEPSFPFDPPDFSQTVGAAIAVGTGRHAGIEHTISEILHWLLLLGFVTVGGGHIGGGGWTRGDSSKDAITKDSLSLEGARLVGEKVTKTASLLKRGAATFKGKLPFILWGQTRF